MKKDSAFQILLILTNKEALALVYTLIQKRQAFENMREMKKTRAASECLLDLLHFQSVLSQCDTWLRLLHLLYDYSGNIAKNSKTRFFYVLYSD